MTKREYYDVPGNLSDRVALCGPAPYWAAKSTLL
jgi:hypothetical protein